MDMAAVMENANHVQILYVLILLSAIAQRDAVALEQIKIAHPAAIQQPAIPQIHAAVDMNAIQQHTSVR